MAILSQERVASVIKNKKDKAPFTQTINIVP